MKMDEQKKKKAKKHLILLTIAVLGVLIALSLMSIFSSGN